MTEWTGRLHDRLLRERVHDTYKSKHKLPEPTVCADCGAVYHRGRWCRDPAPDGAHASVCPACHRIRDHYPAGFVRVSGAFARAHLDEIRGLVRNLAAREGAEHPLKRVMAIEDDGDGVMVTTTDLHLAHAIGNALRDAYDGELDAHYAEESDVLRVRWHRDA
jgi:NMD protein affecting ribosome stability and mRNA decay